MNNIKISLIFACYNVSQYLDKLFELLKTQPYKNIEIIFIEDCSTDNTKEKLQTFRDSRVKLIFNKKNIGAAESRNNGMQIATGEYIWFPDPDDLFDEFLLTRANAIIQQYKPDIVSIGMQEQYEVNGKVSYIKNIVSQYDGLITNDFTDVLVDLEETFLFGYTNNKFYKTALIHAHHILNEHQALKEDFEFNIKAFKQVSNFYLLNKPVYFYMKRNNGSLTSKFVPDYFRIHMQTLASFKSLIEVKGGINKNVNRLLANRFIRYCLSAIERNSSENANMSLSAQNMWIKQHIFNHEQYSEYLAFPNLISNKQKLFYFLIKYKMSLFLVITANLIKLVKAKLPILFVKLKN
ncbi:glycosyltransferase family 2 protein [Bisgaard Taxon 10/6]|uniref:glycosyltransferase family 2 protein n=1 Tax=Exercitatus varius TaxID=67857 RepID=UPI00294AE37D|nr:glycosyltransferase family 2 protein [Exercitatus varius]MDG2939878.1 glycosyltransferase family 2 protein [Exercitatus varius]